MVSEEKAVTKTYSIPKNIVEDIEIISSVEGRNASNLVKLALKEYFKRYIHYILKKDDSTGKKLMYKIYCRDEEKAHKEADRLFKLENPYDNTYKTQTVILE